MTGAVTGAAATREADTAWLVGLHDISLSRVLHALVRLGVPEALADGARTAEELAERCGADRRGLVRVLRPMVGLGILALEDGGYRLTDTGRLLHGGTPGGVAAELALQAEYLAMAEIEESVRTGRPAMVGRGGFYAVVDREPGWADTFREACLSRSRRTFGPLVEGHDWSGRRRIADVGGGLGHHLEAVLRRAPRASGVLLERPAALGPARRRVWRDGTGDRVEFLESDYLHGDLPDADTAMLVNVLHNLTDEECGRLLERLRTAGVERLVVGEYVLPDDQSDFHPGAAADVWMFVAVGGRERTHDEFTRMFARAGWELETINEDPRTRGSLIECRRSG